MEAIKKYAVTFNEPKYNTEYTFHRIKSGAFNYGNGSAVVITRADGHEEFYDTRYNGLVMKDFNQWCIDWLSDHFNPDFEPQWKEI